jgi:hypothetical protein
MPPCNFLHISVWLDFEELLDSPSQLQQKLATHIFDRLFHDRFGFESEMSGPKLSLLVVLYLTAKGRLLRLASLTKSIGRKKFRWKTWTNRHSYANLPGSSCHLVFEKRFFGGLKKSKSSLLFISIPSQRTSTKHEHGSYHVLWNS